MMFTATGLRPAHAVDKSRVFIWLMFFSGLGSSAAGAIMQGQATETYDQYLHTAVQSDMGKLIDDYELKRQQSMIASRTGIGLVIGAILLSFIDAAYIPSPEVQKTPAFLGSEYRTTSDQIISAHTQNGEFLFTIGNRF
jgi:hypothetical protein